MVDYYETRAKNHLSQYLNLLVNKQDQKKKTSQPKIDDFDDAAPNLIGIRKRKKSANLNWSTSQSGGSIDKTKIPQEVAQNFIENMMHTFHNFKDYCADNIYASECTLLDDNDAILANAIKDYDKAFMKDDIDGMSNFDTSENV